MKKQEQIKINKMIEEEQEKAWKESHYYDGKRLRYCNAFVFESENYYFLRSYNTIVAFINKKTKATYDILRLMYGYTSTSAQHISKFRHDYTPYPWNNPVYTWRYV